MRSLISGFLVSSALLAQKPVVFQKGVVNAASYSTEYPSNQLAPGSIVSIFGTNLASSTAWADRTPLPTTLAGTSVTFGGISAPLFFVSPGQINAQLPTVYDHTGVVPPSAVPVAVTTAAGTSAAVDVPQYEEGLGIFTQDMTGCGRGAVFNVATDGSVSLNGPANSVDPNGILTVFGTGFGPTSALPQGLYMAIPDGVPAPSNPFAYSMDRIFASYMAAGAKPLYAGRAPGMVGLDQMNTQLSNAPEGCAVPFRLTSDVNGASQTIPISVHKGGGQCVDPPPTSLAYLKWRRVISSSAIDPPPASDTLVIDFSSAVIGKDFPPVIHFPPRPKGPSCPDFNQNRNLDAGALTLTGAALASTQVRPAMVNGKLTYTATLPPGSIQPGTYTVKASGGADVGPFETSITLPAPIELTSPFPALEQRMIGVSWKGGDPDSAVELMFMDTDYDGYQYGFAAHTLASAGMVSLDLRHTQIHPTSALAILQLPKDSPLKFQAPGLTVGGQHTWRYEFLYKPGGLLPE